MWPKIAEVLVPPAEVDLLMQDAAPTTAACPSLRGPENIDAALGW